MRVESEVIPYEVAWEAALKYLSKFPKNTLLDPRRFYEEVYEPVRDYFIEKVVERQGESRITTRPGSAERAVKQRILFDWMSRGEEKSGRD
ncbi:MAG: hypothetical protein ABWW69_04020 [Pyrodictiaceae archaeon]